MPSMQPASDAPTRILSIKEPFASLIVNGYRPVEHRSRATNFRGRLAIHASLGQTREIWKEWDDQDGDVHYQGMTGLSAKELRGLCRPGHIIGSVDLWDSREIFDCFDDDEDFESGTCNLPAGYEEWLDDGWVWLMKDARLYREPIPASGKLSLWKPDAKLAAAITTAEATAIPCPLHQPIKQPWWMAEDEPIPDDPPDAFYPCAVCEGSGKYEGRTCHFCGGTGKDSSSP